MPDILTTGLPIRCTSLPVPFETVHVRPSWTGGDTSSPAGSKADHAAQRPTGKARQRLKTPHLQTASQSGLMSRSSDRLPARPVVHSRVTTSTNECLSSACNIKDGLRIKRNRPSLPLSLSSVASQKCIPINDPPSLRIKDLDLWKCSTHRRGLRKNMVGLFVPTATAYCCTLKLPSAISMFVHDPKPLLS